MISLKKLGRSRGAQPDELRAGADDLDRRLGQRWYTWLSPFRIGPDGMLQP
jgi:hypothetical protein